MNAEMAQQTSDGHASLKNAFDRVSPIAGSYVKNVAVKLEEQLVESSSQEVLVHTRKSQNMRISFSLRSQPGSNAKHSRFRGTDSSMQKCPENATHSSDSRKVSDCMRPGVRSVPGPVNTLPKSLDVENISSLDFSAADADIPRITSDVQLAVVGSSNGLHSTPMRSVATLNMAMSRDVLIETGSAAANAISVRCGQ